jgi:DNA-binding CsgD family transcriptional regulator
LCRAHYQQAWKVQTLNQFDRRCDTISIEDRLLSKVEKTENGCWELNANRNDYGYGLIWLNGRTVRAHREAFKLWVGPLSDKEVVCHRCDNPPCINPDHLFKGTRLDNNRDTSSKRHFPLGSLHHATKLSDEVVDMIKRSPKTNLVLARELGVNPSTISRIKSGLRRKNLTSLTISG